MDKPFLEMDEKDWEEFSAGLRERMKDGTAAPKNPKDLTDEEIAIKELDAWIEEEQEKEESGEFYWDGGDDA